jgi:hypothetical protein
VEIQHEIASEPQWIDVWFEPALAGQPPWGLLGRMVQSPCVFEIFHAPPRVDQALRCFAKLLAKLVPVLERRARRKRPRSVEAEPPALWIVSAGRPITVLDALGFAPYAGWPSGVYRQVTSALPIHLVVLRDLPRNRDSLILRLMGARRTLRDALDDLARLPAGAWERRAATGAVDLLHSHAADAVAPFEPHEEEIIMSVSELYEQIKDEGRREGERRGEKKGERKGEKKGRRQGHQDLLLRLLKRRFGDVPEELLARVHAADEQQVSEWGERLVFASSLAEIFGE